MVSALLSTVQGLPGFALSALGFRVASAEVPGQMAGRGV